MTAKRWYAQSGVRDEVDRQKGNGEVFTPEHVGLQMVDMVLERDPLLIQGNFLDPSCGNGNLLISVMKRKIKARIHPYDALWAIYGIEIDNDNVIDCQRRLIEFTMSQVDDVCSRAICEELMITVPGSSHPRIVCHETLSWDVDNWKPM
jgi:hypothetical protein